MDVVRKDTQIIGVMQRIGWQHLKGEVEKRMRHGL